MEKFEDKVLKRLNYIFEGEESKIDYIADKINKLKLKYQSLNKIEDTEWISEKDTFLITYGDSLIRHDEKSLNVLNQFLNEKLKGYINNVHILPFFPWTSDDGFSVVDYREIDPSLGSWRDVQEIAKEFNMMYDAVINHISAESDWVKGFLNDEAKYKDYFIVQDDVEELKLVTRPRTLPLLTEFETKSGKKKVWTTFSEDQIDLNFKNEDLFVEIIDILLFYVEMGAKSIRLDAIGYMWKELGTNCIHQPKAHEIIKLWRDIFNEVAPNTILISETNVPHKDNISYFGNGYDEVKMVYQFPLPPLTLHTMQTGNSTRILDWLDGLKMVSDKTTFFNFLSSHDGIGVVPATGLLTQDEIDRMIEKVIEHGGKISYKNNSDGSSSPYEMNINYLEALSSPDLDIKKRCDVLLSAVNILNSIIGVPAIYIHTILGSLNDYEGLAQTGRNRSINREKLDYDVVREELENKESLRNMVFYGIIKQIEARTSEKAFHPTANQKVVKIDDRIFSIIRSSGDEELLVINNISSDIIELEYLKILELFSNKKDILIEIINKKEIKDNKIVLNPYEYMWLK